MNRKGYLGVGIIVATMVLLFVGQWAFGLLPGWAVLAILLFGFIGGLTIAIKGGN